MAYKDQQPVAPIRTVETVAATSRTLSYPATPVGTIMVLDVITTATNTPGLVRPSDDQTDTTWVALAGGGLSTNHQTRRYVRAADGSAGSVKITTVSAAVHTLLTFWSGWQGGTDYSSIYSRGAAGPTGTQYAITGFEAAGAKTGIVLSYVALATNPASWTAWSAHTPIPASASTVNGSRFWHAVEDYDGDAPDTNVTWAGSRVIRYMSAVIPLAATAAPTPRGSGTSSYTIGAAGTGSRASRGAGKTDFAIAAAGTGSRSSRGAGHADYAIAGTGGGSRPSRGSGVTSYGIAGAGSGARKAAGTGAAEYALRGIGQGRTERRGRGELTYALDAAGSGSVLSSGAGQLTFEVTGAGHGTSPVVDSGPMPDVPDIRPLTGGATRRVDGGIDRRLDGGRTNTLTLRRGT